VIEAIRAGRRRIHHVELPSAAGSPALRELAGLVSKAGVAVKSARSGQGPTAYADPFPEESAEQLLGDDRVQLLVALDRVTDVGNLGSIARSAEAAGVDGLLLEHRRVAPIGPGALRASAGALEHLRVGRTPNLRRTLELARVEGFSVLLAEAGGCPLARLDAALASARLIWVLGSEDRGARSAIRRQANAIVGIPSSGSVASLGVAAAAAYLLLRTAELRAGLAEREACESEE